MKEKGICTKDLIPEVGRGSLAYVDTTLLFSIFKCRLLSSQMPLKAVEEHCTGQEVFVQLVCAIQMNAKSKKVEKVTQKESKKIISISLYKTQSL